MISLDDIEVASEIKISMEKIRSTQSQRSKDELILCRTRSHVQDPKQWLPENTLPTGYPRLI